MFGYNEVPGVENRYKVNLSDQLNNILTKPGKFNLEATYFPLATNRDSSWICLFLTIDQQSMLLFDCSSKLVA